MQNPRLANIPINILNIINSMELDNVLIKTNLKTLKDELRILNTQKSKLENIISGYGSIDEIEESIPNSTGGYDLTKKTPNIRNLSKNLLTQERQITYTDCNEKFTDRNK